MKLVTQTPCHNEVGQLSETLAALPRAVRGFDTVERIVIDDGSVDGTAELAASLGVDAGPRSWARQRWGWRWGWGCSRCRCAWGART